MSIYIVGDLHLSNNENIKKPMSVFGDNWRAHDEKIKNYWKENVKDGDIVIIAGDTSWAMKPEEVKADIDWIEELPGKKIMIKGNHDFWWQSVNKLRKAFPGINFIQNSCAKEGNVVICGSRGWICPGSDGFEEGDAKIFRRELFRMEASLKEGVKSGAEEIIVAMHYPPTNEKKQPSEFTAMFEKYGVTNVYYGHLHGKENFSRGFEGNLNGVEYKLISIDKLNFTLWKIR